MWDCPSVLTQRGWEGDLGLIPTWERMTRAIPWPSLHDPRAFSQAVGRAR